MFKIFRRSLKSKSNLILLKHKHICLINFINLYLEKVKFYSLNLTKLRILEEMKPSKYYAVTIFTLKINFFRKNSQVVNGIRL
jgi:hypothetical protein